MSTTPTTSHELKAWHEALTILGRVLDQSYEALEEANGLGLLHTVDDNGSCEHRLERKDGRWICTNCGQVMVGG